MQQFDKQTQHEQIYNQAAQWLDILADGELDHWHKRRFIKWLNSAAEHQRVFESMLATWQDPALQGAFKQLNAEKKAASRKHEQWRFGLVAACLLVLCISVLWYQQGPQPSSVQTLTAANNNTPHTLADGSLVQVQPSSEVVVKYSTQQRDLQLRSGQAYFAVAKDQQRPFVVATEFANVTAVGTEFNIDRSENFVAVTVYEGVVEVKNTATKQFILVKAGEHIRLARQHFAVIEKVDLKNLVDWRSGWIEISDQSLNYLIEHLNRYSDKTLVLQTEQLKQRKIAGRFRLDDTEQVVKLLSQMYGLKVATDDYTIRLTL